MTKARSSTTRCFLAVLAVYVLFLVLQFFPPRIPEAEKYLPGDAFLHLCIALLACIACLISGGSLRRDLMLCGCRGVCVPAGICLWGASMLLSELSIRGLSLLFPRLSVAGATFTGVMRTDGFLPALLFSALIPAICEELFFRGYMLSTLRRAFGVIPACLICAALFGVSHVSPERMIPMLLFGFFLSLAGCFSGSVFIPMLIHFLNNLTFVFAKYCPAVYTDISDTLFEKGIWLPLLLAALLLCVGILLLRGGTRFRR